MMTPLQRAEAQCQRVYAEVQRAITLHKPMNSAHEAHSVIQEEFEEFWDEVKLNPKRMSEAERSNWRSRMRNELTQTAAMCVRALVDLEL